MASLRETVVSLRNSESTLAAIGAAIEAKLAGRPADPYVAEVLSAADVAIDGLSDTDLRSTLGELRAFAITNTKLLFSRGEHAWRYTERELLEAAGDVSIQFPHVLAGTIAPSLDGLSDRLGRPGAAFLDVGVGVGALSIEMARIWPQLRVVGIDPWAPSLAIARERVRAAGLEARIELREQAGEDLREHEAFDLAFVPSLFIPESALPFVFRRVHAALRPGGWALVPTMKSGTDRLSTALARLRTSLFGGALTTPEAMGETLRMTFGEARILPGPPHAVATIVVARKE